MVNPSRFANLTRVASLTSSIIATGNYGYPVGVFASFFSRYLTAESSTIRSSFTDKSLWAMQTDGMERDRKSEKEKMKRERRGEERNFLRLFFLSFRVFALAGWGVVFLFFLSFFFFLFCFNKSHTRHFQSRRIYLSLLSLEGRYTRQGAGASETV